MFDSILEFFSVDGLLEIIVNFWNKAMELSYGLLLTTPQDFQSGAPWEIMNKVYPFFVALGSSLLVLFFIVGFCIESINIRDEMRLEKIFKMFIKFVLSNALVFSGLGFIKVIFNSISGLTGLVMSSYPTMKITDAWTESLADGGIINWFLLLIVLLFAIISGGSVLYALYSRFFKLFLIIPFAPVALSAIAGSGGIVATAGSWVRTFFAYSLEIVVIALALALSGAMSAGAASIFPDTEGSMAAVLTIANVGFTMLITAGAVRGAEPTVRKALGLH